jgi:competence protein ComGC
MKDNKIYTLVGVIFLVLYLLSVLILLYNFKTEVKMQNTRQLNLINFRTAALI